eukprot:TRINITY_DN1499_c0_g1_i1.p1 TRINITY_DN1499_c0_g1~~TRINITY_DN1499_c0_g1_i1.p1  ORF type:complete len:508 (-),score=93.55 TRINITY_DN1499_c0_g1_i1:9-1532(-)
MGGIRSDIFLTTTEKEALSCWVSKDEDNSITTLTLTPLWSAIARTLVPDSVSSNILSFGAFLCVVHAWYLCHLYMATQPFLISIAAIILLVAYHTLDGIDDKHARNTRTDSPMGEFFAHCCCNVGFVFSTLTVCYVLGIDDLSTRWYLVQIGQLVALWCHMRAFRTKVVSFSTFTGPGEGLFAVLLLMSIKAIFPSIFVHFSSFVTKLFVFLNSQGIITSLDPYDYNSIIRVVCSSTFYVLIVVTLAEAAFKLNNNPATRNGLIFCLLYRAGPAVLMWLEIMPGSFTTLDLICEGLFMSVLTSDLILSKMASRDLHPYIVIFAMLSVLDNFLILVVVFIYYITTLYEISEYMQLPIFGMTRNVYVDGVYDMCHLGHFNSFKRALGYGTRLIVGVLSDSDVAKYKRSPIMTMEERAAVVATSKHVHKVIAPCPFPGIPAEFIRQHRIHIVCHSPEYDGPKDIYYTVPRAMGITRVMPRTEGMSTSELIKRTVEYSAADKKSKDKNDKD